MTSKRSANDQQESSKIQQVADGLLHPTPSRPVRYEVRRSSLRSERSRPSREPKRRTNAGRVWGDHSAAYPDELKVAARRLRSLEGRGLNHEDLCAALAVYARIPDLGGQPHHAVGFTEYVARCFIARLREDRRAAEKKSEAISVRVDRGLRSIASILGSAS